MEQNPFNKPESCYLCPLFHASPIVPGSGPGDARMMIVSEAPGEEEVRERKPMVGGAGKILNSLFWQAGIPRSGVYITNVVKCRPAIRYPNGKTVNRQPTEAEIRHCAPFLIAEIKEVNPNVIVAMGAPALRTLTGKDSIFNHRGVPIKGYGDKKVIGTFNPAFLMRSQGQWPVPIFDLERAKQEALYPEIRITPVRYGIDPEPTPELTAGILARARAAGFVTFDLETSPQGKRPDPRYDPIICVGLGSSVADADCLRWEPRTAALVKELFEDPTIEKVGQNSEGFDIWFIEDQPGGPTLRGPSFDTMQAFHLIYSDLPKNLGHISSYSREMEYWKNEIKTNLFEYNCKDIDNTTRAYFWIKARLRAFGMEHLYYNRVVPLQRVLRKMTIGGIKKDVALAHAYGTKMLELADQKEANLRGAFERPLLDLNSPQQLRELLYTDLRLPMQYKKNANGEMRPSTDKDSLRKLMDITGNKILQEILDVRTLRKYESTFTSVEVDENDFVHPRFASVFPNDDEEGDARGPATGRLASRDPNAQNIPVNLRSIYIPDSPEHVIVSCDWSQIEWRLAMVLSGDAVGLELLLSGKDNHKAVAAEAMGLNYDTVTDDQRHQSKFIVYGLGYGRGKKDLSKQLKQPESWVEAFIDRFFRRFIGFKTWRDTLVKTVEKDHYLVNAFNRRRWWFSRQVTEMYNYPMQSNAADMMYDAILSVDRQLPKDARICLTVHDELVLMAAKDVVKEAVACVKENMEVKWPNIVAASYKPEVVKRFYPNGWYCPAEPHLGNNWKESKKGNKDLEKQLLGGVL